MAGMSPHRNLMDSKQAHGFNRTLGGGRFNSGISPGRANLGLAQGLGRNLTPQHNGTEFNRSLVQDRNPSATRSRGVGYNLNRPYSALQGN